MGVVYGELMTLAHVTQAREALAGFAHATALRLTDAGAPDPLDLDALGAVLRDALDAAELLRTSLDRGAAATRPLIESMETLLRAVLTTSPRLQRAELDILHHFLVERADTTIGQREASRVSALRSRAMHASVELHSGLAAAYRSLFDTEVES